MFSHMEFVRFYVYNLTKVKLRVKAIKYFLLTLPLHMFSPIAFMFTFEAGLSSEGHQMWVNMRVKEEFTFVWQILFLSVHMSSFEREEFTFCFSVPLLLQPTQAHFKLD